MKKLLDLILLQIQLKSHKNKVKQLLIETNVAHHKQNDFICREEKLKIEVTAGNQAASRSLLCFSAVAA